MNDQSSYLYLYEHNVPVWLIIECTDQLTQGPVELTPLSDMCLLMTWCDVTTMDITCVDWEDGGNGIKKTSIALPTGGT